MILIPVTLLQTMFQVEYSRDHHGEQLEGVALEVYQLQEGDRW